MRFNINDSILVKLTNKGYQHLADNHNEYCGVVPNWDKRDAGYYANKANKKGYSKFQMWTFIQEFGDVTRLGMDNFYETEIILCEKGGINESMDC